MVIGLDTLSHEERLKGLGSFSLEKQGLEGISSQALRCCKYRDDEGALFMKMHCDGQPSCFRPDFASRHKKNFSTVRPTKGCDRLPGGMAKFPKREICRAGLGLAMP